MSESRSKSRRRILVDKPFQLKYCFFICSWLFALIAVYPLIIHQLFEFFMKNMADKLSVEDLQALAVMKSEVIAMLILSLSLFLLVIFFISLFTSHRIAGPLYQLSVRFSEVIEGKTPQPAKFRQSDHFQHLAIQYNQVLSVLEGRELAREKAVMESIHKLEGVLNNEEFHGRKEVEEALGRLRKSFQ